MLLQAQAEAKHITREVADLRCGVVRVQHRRIQPLVASNLGGPSGWGPLAVSRVLPWLRSVSDPLHSGSWARAGQLARGQLGVSEREELFTARQSVTARVCLLPRPAWQNFSRPRLRLAPSASCSARDQGAGAQGAPQGATSARSRGAGEPVCSSSRALFDPPSNPCTLATVSAPSARAQAQASPQSPPSCCSPRVGSAPLSVASSAAAGLPAGGTAKLRSYNSDTTRS